MKQEYYRLKFKEETIFEKMKTLIVRAVTENNGRITFKKDDDEDDYPITTALYGRKDIYFISITDVYLDNGGLIYADKKRKKKNETGNKTGHGLHLRPPRRPGICCP